MIASNQPNQPSKYCQYCGIPIDATSKFCAFCGTKQDADDNTVTIQITPRDKGKCPACGEILDREDTKYCPACGHDVGTGVDVKYDTTLPEKAGIEIEVRKADDDSFKAEPAPEPASAAQPDAQAGFTVAPQTQNGPVVSHLGHRVDRVTAGVLALVVGFIGVQHFYMGRIGAGIVSVIFFWTGIPFIIGLVQGIVYLCASDDEFCARHLHY
jgi:hypothetical protein